MALAPGSNKVKIRFITQWLIDFSTPGKLPVPSATDLDGGGHTLHTLFHKSLTLQLDSVAGNPTTDLWDQLLQFFFFFCGIFFFNGLEDCLSSMRHKLTQ